MASSGIGRAVRAAIGNAVMWGVTWTGLSLVTMAGLRFFGLIPQASHPLDYLGMALRIGFLGGIAGVLFSAVVRVRYRGWRLDELRAWRFGLVGGLATAVLVPTFMQLSSLLTGGGFVPWGDINEDIVLVGVFGGFAAGLSVKLAQVASRFAQDEPVPEIDRSAVLERLGTPIDAATRERWDVAGNQAPASRRPGDDRNG